MQKSQPDLKQFSDLDLDPNQIPAGDEVKFNNDQLNLRGDLKD